MSPKSKHRPASGSTVLEKKFLTVAEVATLMRVSKMTIYRLCNSGELESIKVGRVFRIPEAAAAKLSGGTAAGA